MNEGAMSRILGGVALFASLFSLVQLEAQEAVGAADAGRIEAAVTRLARRVDPHLVKVYGAKGIRGIPGFGTGVVVDARGLILTAWSVSLDHDRIRVVDARGRERGATIHRRADALGVALLKLAEPLSGLEPMPLGDSASLRLGQRVWSFGNAFQVAVGAERMSVCEGIVVARGPLDARVGVLKSRLVGEVILTDAANNPGTQGGALTDLEGRLMALNARVVESRSTNTPLNVAVPVARLRGFIEEGRAGFARARAPRAVAAAERSALRVKLGLRLLRFHFTRPPPAYIDAVRAGSPAARAGLRPDDLLFQLAGVTIRSTEDYDRVLRGLSPGRAIKVSVKRGRRMVQLSLTPEALEGSEKR
jgi:S1-C subfamily serine protease